MPTTPNRVSNKVRLFTESVIREMTRLAMEHDAINLAQGFPDFPAPEEIKTAACQAIREDINQYAVTWGAARLREAIAEKYSTFYHWEPDPEKEVTIGCGSTECMIASILGVADPGHRLLVLEPFYENYGPDAILAGAVPEYVRLDAKNNWSLRSGELEDAIRRSQAEGGIRALILNDPNNPSGKVFHQEELSLIARLAQEHDFFVITDEIYEHIVYEGIRHRPIALLPGMRERTVTISGLSKTFSVTGWRVGYIIAPPDLTEGIRKVHDFLTVGAAAPLQEAGAHALKAGPGYYERLAEEYRERRDYLCEVLWEIGFKFERPLGAYYILADISSVTDLDDVAFVARLLKEHRVATVPGSSFFHEPETGKRFIRFAFCKSLGLLREAGERLLGLRREPIVK